MANEAGASTTAALVQARAVPPLLFNMTADLPISARREAILEALAHHQVLIVAGDTGSGKSTQLPQYCLELGRGRAGLDRPYAAAPSRGARSGRAHRGGIVPAGRPTVGFRVRFADQVSAATRLVLMTDGLLLAELARIRCCAATTRSSSTRRTSARSTSICCSGVLKRLLPRRPELKLIVTSATLEVERVSRFFDDAPIITVSGRNHPIEVRYAAAGRRRGSRSAGGGARRPIRKSPRRRDRSAAAMCWCFCRASAKSATSPSCSSASCRASARCSRCTRGSHGSSRARFSSAGAHGGSCWRPMSRRPRSPCPASARSSIPGSRASAATARATGCSACRSSRCRAPAPISARAAAGASAPGCACGCTPRRTSRRARTSPSRRCCAPISRRCCCASPRTDWARRRISRSSIRPIARAQRRLSAAARAAGARCRAAHHAPRPGHGAPAARSAPGAGAAREQALSRAKANCWRSSRA